MDLPYLGALADLGDAVREPRVVNSPSTAGSAVLRDLADRLFGARAANPVRRLSVVGPGARVGRTTTAVNLAAATARSGRSVTIVSSAWRDIVVDGVTSVPLDLGLELGAWPDVGRFERGVRAIEQLCDVVIVDTEPSDLAPHLLGQAAVCEAAVIVAMRGRTNEAALARAREDLERLGVSVYGVLATVPRWAEREVERPPAISEHHPPVHNTPARDRLTSGRA